MVWLQVFFDFFWFCADDFSLFIRNVFIRLGVLFVVFLTN